MKKQVIAYKEGNEYLIIVYGIEGKINYVAILPEEKKEDYNKCLAGYSKDGYTIENPDYMTDEDLQQALFDVACLTITTNNKREQK